MAVRGRGAVVTWPTIALLLDSEQSRGRGADLALHVDGHDAMATLAFARALVEEGHGRVRLLLVQAHALRPPHLSGEFIVHGCCLMSGWVRGGVALARPPRGGGTIDKDPAGTGLGHGLAGRSMPRAPSMQLVEHMDGGRGDCLDAYFRSPIPSLQKRREFKGSEPPTGRFFMPLFRGRHRTRFGRGTQILGSFQGSGPQSPTEILSRENAH